MYWQGTLCLRWAATQSWLSWCPEDPEKSWCLKGRRPWQLSLVRCQLTQVFTDIFNTLLNQGVVPSCFKTAVIPTVISTVIPVPKIHYFISQWLLPSSTHPHQGSDLQKALPHSVSLSCTPPEPSTTGILWMLFQDFSAAFNTITPHHLVNKLNKLGLGTHWCKWLLDFLTNRQLNWCGLVTSQCHLPEHQIPSGLCPESIIVHPDGQWLLCQDLF